MSIRTPIPRCNLYNQHTPDDVLRFLKDVGNITNDKTTITTPLEVWRSTAECEASFSREKQAMGWTIGSLGQSKMDEKKCVYQCVAPETLGGLPVL